MIRTLKLTNFKGFATLNLTLGPLTLLSGLNGTGKSSLIQALLLLRQSWQQGLLQDHRLALNGELVQIGTARDALYSYADEDTIGIGLEFSDGDSTSWAFAYDRDADVLRAAQSKPAPTSDHNTQALFSADFQYLCAERIGPRTSFSMSDYAVRQQRQLGVRGEFTAHYLAAFGTSPIPLDSLIHAGTNQRDLNSQVEAWLSDISPGAKIVLKPLPALDLVQLQYQFATGSELTDAYRPTNVGFGLTYILPIIVAVLASHAGTLLLFENPEAHLHPRGQRRIGELLGMAAAAGVQVVVETHSDHVLNGLRVAIRDSRIQPSDATLQFFCRVEEEGQTRLVVTSPSVDKDGRISEWPNGFFDEWDSALAQLLIPRR